MSEKWKRVIKVDHWAQDNDIVLDHAFSGIYQESKGNGYGWEGIEEEDPVQFSKAYTLALENEHRM